MVATFRQLLARFRCLAPALALALLFSGLQDLHHDHGSKADAQQCYACHFTPDLGLAPEAEVPTFAELPMAAAAPRVGAAPSDGITAGYDARGPPLLS